LNNVHSCIHQITTLDRGIVEAVLNTFKAENPSVFQYRAKLALISDISFSDSTPDLMPDYNMSCSVKMLTEQHVKERYGSIMFVIT